MKKKEKKKSTHNVYRDRLDRLVQQTTTSVTAFTFRVIKMLTRKTLTNVMLNTVDYVQNIFQQQQVSSTQSSPEQQNGCGSRYFTLKAVTALTSANNSQKVKDIVHPPLMECETHRRLLFFHLRFTDCTSGKYSSIKLNQVRNSKATASEVHVHGAKRKR